MQLYLTGKLHTGAMWQLRFINDRMQSCLERLNLGPRLANNKLK